MKVLWICGLPHELEQTVLGGKPHGAHAAWSWVMGHLPPPPGVELHIACRTARHTTYQEFDHAGAHFHLVPVKSRARLIFLFHFDWEYFRDLAVRLSPDIIHGWGTEDGYANVAVRLSPNRHLVQVQGCINTYRQRVPMHWLTRFNAFSERRVLARARHVVAENEYALSSAQSMMRTESVHVVEHPIRTAFLESNPATGDGRQVVFVGAINERKGIWDALEAFRKAAPENWKLIIIGNGRPESMEQLRQRMLVTDLKDRAIHHPQMTAEGIVSSMQSSSVFLLPTMIDTGPTSLKEAIAMGLWPVCFDNSGPAHYLRKFQFGTLAKDLDRADLTEKLRQVIATQPWREPAQRAKIKSIIRPHLGRERIWEDLQKLYRQIIATDSSVTPNPN